LFAAILHFVSCKRFVAAQISSKGENMTDTSDRSSGNGPGPSTAGRLRGPPDPGEAARRAAALEALRKEQPAKSASTTFWQQHGGKVVLAAVLLLAFWLVALGVGKYLRTSITETSRSEEELRRAMR
jgi:hypothetical protein